LIARTVAVTKIDNRMREGMWTVFRRYYAEVSREKFEADLAKKRDVILLIDSGDHTIQGFSTLEVYERRERGRSFVSVFSGDTVIDENYWGQSALQREFVRYVVRLKLKNPFRAVYWFLISKGYKTYLLLSRNYWTYWPRWNKPTPAWEACLIEDLATEKYGASYDANSGVLHFDAPEGRLKNGVAPINEKLLAHPDIAFFCDRNPGHTLGDELCCLGKVDALLWLKFTLRLIKKLFVPSQKAPKKREARRRATSVA
jgi:hypothetical protein